MGMMIDEAIKELITIRGGIKYALTIPIYSDEDKEDREIDKVQLEAIIMAIDTMRKYQMMQADYNARLKADLEAILVELQLEIGEKEQYYQDKFLESENGVHDLKMAGRMYGCGECKELVQQEIDKLKEVEE